MMRMVRRVMLMTMTMTVMRMMMVMMIMIVLMTMTVVGAPGVVSAQMSNNDTVYQL